MATLTPNYNLSKPDATDNFSTFRQSYNDNMDIIDNNLGGGGGSGDTVAWTQIQATGTKIAEIDINGNSQEVYAPQGGGSGGHTIYDEDGTALAQENGLQFTGAVNVSDDSVNGRTVVNIESGGSTFGFAIDENNKLFEGTINNFNQSLSYTATEDGIALCWYKGSVGTWQFLLVNGVMLRLGGDGTNTPVSYSIPIRKGDTVSARYQSGSESCYFWLSVYGIKQGTNGIFAPVIYSDTERKIGIWRDNKPLYQKTWDISDLTISNSSWTTSTIPIGDIETVVSALATNQNGKAFWGDIMVSLEVNPTYIAFQTGRNGNNERYRYVTIQYTKTTDVAGSGDWNTDGVPTEHYSTSEKVIGTWVDGKPIYEKTVQATATIPYNTWASTGIVVDANAKQIVRVAQGCALTGAGCMEFIAYIETGGILNVMNMRNVDYGNNYQFYITVQYTKTTD